MSAGKGTMLLRIQEHSSLQRHHRKQCVLLNDAFEDPGTIKYTKAPSETMRSAEQCFWEMQSIFSLDMGKESRAHKCSISKKKTENQNFTLFVLRLHAGYLASTLAYILSLSLISPLRGTEHTEESRRVSVFGC